MFVKLVCTVVYVEYVFQIMGPIRCVNGESFKRLSHYSLNCIDEYTIILSVRWNFKIYFDSQCMIFYKVIFFEKSRPIRPEGEGYKMFKISPNGIWYCGDVLTLQTVQRLKYGNAEYGKIPCSLFTMFTMGNNSSISSIHMYKMFESLRNFKLKKCARL